MLAADHQPLPLPAGSPLSANGGASDLTERDALLPPQKNNAWDNRVCSLFCIQLQGALGRTVVRGRQRGLLWQPHRAAVPPRHSCPGPGAGLWQNSYACTTCPPLPKPSSMRAVGTETPPCPRVADPAIGTW